jgi:acetylglutamate kinase
VTRRNTGTKRRANLRGSAPLVVVKLGGELIEDDASAAKVGRVLARAAKNVTLVVIHGGGKEIDAALAQASIPKHQVDGLRVTDESTLKVVVAVLAGTINARLVNALNGAGSRAVGLTGADAGVTVAKKMKPHRTISGELVDLGLVGEPLSSGDTSLIDVLCGRRFVPVVACIAASKAGRLLNVNADTLAGSLAARLRASRLVIGGGTPGVLDGDRGSIAHLDRRGIAALVSSGTATAGMVAKLRACRAALAGGVSEVIIADGRGAHFADLITGTAPDEGAWTRLA